MIKPKFKVGYFVSVSGDTNKKGKIVMVDNDLYHINRSWLSQHGISVERVLKLRNVNSLYIVEYTELDTENIFGAEQTGYYFENELELDISKIRQEKIDKIIDSTK